MKHDPAHEFTDEEIAKIEKQIAKEYKKAHKEVSKKLDDYLSRFAAKDKKWQEWVANGTKTEKEYAEWKKGQVLIGKRWEDMRDQLAEDYTNAAAIAQSIAKGHAPQVYAVNHNYATFEVEKGSLINTSYTLYSRESVERMYRENPRLYHKYGKAVGKQIKLGKQMAWDKRRIQSVLMQGILQGESIPNLTKRLEQVTGGDHKAAIRNARTMMTGVQNAGRTDAFQRALDMGIPVKKQWLATLDARTRHWHRQLDGVAVEVDEPFKNEFGSIMFPGDPEADAANIHNCRCTLIAQIKGFEIDTADLSLRHDAHLGEMTYEEWLAEKNSISNPIDLPEKKAAAIKGAWWGKYGGGAGKTHAFPASEGKKLMDDWYAGEAAKAKEELDKLGAKEYSDIWAGKTVKVSDYASMETPIKVKHYYLDNKIKDAAAKGDTKALAKYKAQKKSLEAFEKDGKKWLADSGIDVAPKATKKAADTAKKASKASSVGKAAKTAEKAEKAASATAKPKPLTEAKAKKAVKEAQDKVDDLAKYKYSNIWVDDVTPADYAEKKAKIAGKKKYLQDKYDEAVAHGWSDKEVKFKKLLDDLDDFEKNGIAYEKAKAELDAANKALKPFTDAKKTAIQKDLDDIGKKTYDLSIAGVHGPAGYTDPIKIADITDADIKKLKEFKKTFAHWGPDDPDLQRIDKVLDDLKAQKKLERALDKLERGTSAVDDAYSASRKAKALWARDGWDGALSNKEYLKADAYFEKLAKKVHDAKSAWEHEGYYHYTWGSGPFNRVLAGFTSRDSWTGFKGPGKVDINLHGYGERIRGLTSLISKSKYDQDFWVQSGQGYATLESFLKIPSGTLERMTDAELQKYVGATQQLPQFVSGSINKGGGSYCPGDMLFNIYCPKGSEALYVREDGHFEKAEHEMILQRGGTYRIDKIYWGTDVHGNRRLICDLELRVEKGYNKFQQ